MEDAVRRWLIGLLAFAALVAVLANFAELRNFLALVRHAQPVWLVAAVVLQISTYVSVAAAWRTVLKAAGSPLKLRSLVPLSISKFFADQAIPTAGMSGNVLVVDRLMTAGVPRGNAISALLVSMVGYYCAYAVLAVIVLVLLWLHDRATPLLAWTISLFLLVAAAIPGTALLLIRSGRRPPGLLMRFRLLRRVVEALGEARTRLVKRPALVGRVAGFNMSVFLADAVTLHVALLATGEAPDFSTSLIAFILASIAVTLAPTPMGLGSFEAACIGMLRVLGVPLEPAIAATLFLRGFTLWLPLALGFGLTRWMMNSPPEAALPRPDRGKPLLVNEAISKRAKDGPGRQCSHTGALDSLRLALFTANYNGVRDGANNATNRLVAYLLERGAAVRIYSPTIRKPSFEAPGEIVSIPSIPIPGRPEYRWSLGLPRSVRRDLRQFAPTVFHVTVPDVLGRTAERLARELGVPLVASMHTRFETYFRYYGLGFIQPFAERYLRSFYRRCDCVLLPTAALQKEFEGYGLTGRTRIWPRGVDTHLFSPARRSLDWRHRMGFEDDDIVLLFFGRLVREKGLDTFEAVTDALRVRGARVKPLVVGMGPDRDSVEQALPHAVFTGFLQGIELATAVASADVMLNPSVTEAFGNVNLEAMASGIALISADVPSAQALIEPGRTGLLVLPGDVGGYVGAVERLIGDRKLRLRLGVEAAREAQEHHLWSTGLEAVVDAYRMVGAIPSNVT
jgi:uncharacterized protein (TIRG00374 family)